MTSQDARPARRTLMCTVASAPAAFRVRVWHLMSREQWPRGGDRCRRSFVLPIRFRRPTASSLGSVTIHPAPVRRSQPAWRSWSRGGSDRSVHPPHRLL